MISTPEIRSSVGRLANSHDPIAVAASPERMKIVEKLPTNSRLRAMTRRSRRPRADPPGRPPETVAR